MKTDLAIIGQGAVTPAGLGIEVLVSTAPTPVPVGSIGHPEEKWPVFRVDQRVPALLQWQKEPRLRRASPITLYLVEAAAQALRGSSAEDRAETGLIIAFSAGCLEYSSRFFNGLVTQGRKAASPMLFPETVFNSPGSHVITVLKLNGAAYATVGDETAWVAALKTAAVWLKQKRVRQVLVLGAEEFDPLVLDAYRSAGWLRRGAVDLPFRASEGAAGVLVRAATPDDPIVIAEARDGFVYRSRKEADAAADRLWRDVDPSLPFHVTADRNILARLEQKVTASRPALGQEQPYLGEAFTASAAWNTLRAAAKLGNSVPRLLVPTWGLNHQFGLLELSRP